MTTAAESIEALSSGDKEALLELVYEHIHGCRFRGAIADEASASLGLVHNCVAPRFTDLAEAGRIVKLLDSNGKPVKRKTRLGCAAAVWIASEFAAESSRASASLFGDLSPDRSYRE